MATYLEAKEKIQIQPENQTLASITYQNYFKLYKKISGCTGTAVTESQEFLEIYNLPVVVIPTNKKMIRKDFNDQIFRTEEEKNNPGFNMRNVFTQLYLIVGFNYHIIMISQLFTQGRTLFLQLGCIFDGISLLFVLL